MVTTPLDPEHEPNEAEKIARRALELSREALAGDVQGSVRRIILYTITFVLMAFAIAFPEATKVSLVLASGTLAILALSDQLA